MSTDRKKKSGGNLDEKQLTPTNPLKLGVVHSTTRS